MRELDKTKISIWLMAIIHLVGLVGLSIEATQSYFLYLTPLNLLITFSLFLWANDDFTPNFIILLTTCAVYGLVIEIIGVQTGVLFGSYQYGEYLGWKIRGVPLLIGTNWFLLCYLSAGIANFLTKNFFTQIFLGALFTLAIDFPMEPVALHIDFWSWENGHIPFQNYAMWFVTALIIQALIAWRPRHFNIRLSMGFYLIQLLFFTLLNITLGLWPF